jgi:hypothetical protein
MLLAHLTQLAIAVFKDGETALDRDGVHVLNFWQFYWRATLSPSAVLGTSTTASSRSGEAAIHLAGVTEGLGQES